jgi:epoxyqueuosine reductase
MKILVHICCGPCAITPVRDLLEAGMGVTGLYYNPNIHPLQEYLRRREGVVQMADRLGIPVIFKDDEYDPQDYFRAVTYRESNRCLPCYSLRLERTLSIARRGGFEAFTSTLLYSKFQKHELIRTLGRDLADGNGRGVPLSGFSLRLVRRHCPVQGMGDVPAAVLRVPVQ